LKFWPTLGRYETDTGVSQVGALTALASVVLVADLPLHGLASAPALTGAEPDFACAIAHPNVRLTSMLTVTSDSPPPLRIGPSSPIRRHDPVSIARNSDSTILETFRSDRGARFQADRGGTFNTGANSPLGKETPAEARWAFAQI